MSDELPVVKCPSCGVECCLEAEAAVPPSQTLTIRLESESKYLPAEVIGATIKYQTEIFKSVAKQMGTAVAVFISKMTTTDHVAEIEFTITAVASSK